MSGKKTAEELLEKAIERVRSEQPEPAIEEKAARGARETLAAEETLRGRLHAVAVSLPTGVHIGCGRTPEVVCQFQVRINR